MKQISRKYWDKMAASSPANARDAVLAGFRSETGFDDAGRIDAATLVLPFVSPRMAVLDVGCGVGRLAKWVASHCRSLLGLDISKEMLARARDRLQGIPNVALKAMPLALEFPVATATIDFAYFYHVSEHMEREDAYKILCEIRRCLRKNGTALIQFSLISHPDNQNEFRRWVRNGDEEGVRSRFYTEQESDTLLRMARLYPQIRLYIPGEFVVIVVKSDHRVLGEMPLVNLRTALPNHSFNADARRQRFALAAVAG